MPNKEVIRKWVDALRSGEYKQGEGQLEKDGCFCCLGVLCDLAVKEDVILPPIKKEVNERDYSEVVNHYDDVWDFLPSKVQEWAGLDSDCPKLEYDYYEEGCEEPYSGEAWANELNDDGFSFEELANLIEEQYLGEGENE